MAKLETLELDQIVESTYQGRLIRPQTEDGKNDDPPFQKLSQSIETEGLMNPIVVRKVGERYEIVDGHRRFEAYKRLKKDSIDCIVTEYDDKQAQAFSVIGNLHRQNLSAIEKAIAFRKILEFGTFRDTKELSHAIGKNETYVGDVLNTLKMDQRIINDLVQNRTTDDVRLLRAFRRIEKAENNVSKKQWELYQQFKDENLTRNDIIKKVKEARSPAPKYLVETLNKKVTINLKNVLSEENQMILINHIEEKLKELFPVDSSEDSESSE